MKVLRLWDGADVVYLNVAYVASVTRSLHSDFKWRVVTVDGDAYDACTAIVENLKEF